MAILTDVNRKYYENDSTFHNFFERKSKTVKQRTDKSIIQLNDVHYETRGCLETSE
jgi:hypothetical protein